MPFRKLPDTDISRLEALRVAYSKTSSMPAEEIFISSENLNKLQSFYPDFKREMEERGDALSVQSEATRARKEAEEKCRMYVSHFFQVFNLGITRGIYKVTERAYYQIGISDESVPDLRGGERVKTWAENIISGETKRTAAGGAAMVNPSSEEVRNIYDDYSAKLSDQSNKKDSYEKEQKDVVNLRDEADELIRDIWDEIEFKFRKEEPSSMRRKAREYGVTYVSRPGEPVEEETPGTGTGVEPD